MARALTRLQAGFGGARVVKGKGHAAAAVRALLLRMRQEAGAEGPIVGAAPIPVMPLKGPRQPLAACHGPDAPQ